MKYPVVILHGWGSTMSGKRYSTIKKILQKKGFTVLTPDLPGFGNNTLKSKEIFFDDYVTFVKHFLDKQKLSRVILIGHSFGGRIAIAFAAAYPAYVSRLILAAPSGIPHPLPSLKKKIIFYATKMLKPIFAVWPFAMLYRFLRRLVYYLIGEMDYYKSGQLAKTFTNVYQKDIRSLLPKIKAKTLIVWGEDDSFVPARDGMVMHNAIKNSQLVLLAHEGHKFPCSNSSLFAEKILPFIL